MPLQRRAFLRQLGLGMAVLPQQLAWSRPTFQAQTRTTAETAAVMGEPKFVDVGGIRTRYFEKGSGDAMVLVHGGSIGTNGGATGWWPIWGQLAQTFHVYALDRLGMGGTDNPKRDEDYSMKATVQHLHGFLTALKIQSAHLVGSSRGALPVARQAVDHPEMTRTLIMFNSNTVAPDDPSTPIDWYYRNPRAKPANPKVAEAESKMLLLGSQWVERNHAPADLSNIDGPSVWWLRELKFETIELIKAGKLKSPTLIIWGLDDESAPLVLAFNLISLVGPVVPTARLHVMNKAAHGPYSAQPDETVRMITDFIKYLPRSN